MKNIFNRIKNSILVDTIIYTIFIIVLCYILGLLNLQFRRWVYYISILIITLGTIIGAIQLYRSKGKAVKSIILTITIVIIIGLTIVGRLLLIGIVMWCSTPIHITNKNGNKYVAVVQSWHHTTVAYYKYINFFVMGKEREFLEIYDSNTDPFIDKTNVEIVTKEKLYYSDVNKSKEIVGESDYEWEFENNVKIRVSNQGYYSGKYIMLIEKSIDNGENWSTLTNIDVAENAKFLFINENTGFINDPRLKNEDNNYVSLRISTDGGKRFEQVTFNHPDNIEEKYILTDELPYIENDMLILKVYTLNHSKNPEKTYYDFISEDNGVTWNIRE